MEREIEKYQGAVIGSLFAAPFFAIMTHDDNSEDYCTA